MNDSRDGNTAMPQAHSTGSVLLTNDVGLHARPSVKLTQLAKRFDAHIEFALEASGPWVDAKSPVKVMRFKAAKGATLHFRASGADASLALAAILALIARGFEAEDDETPRSRHG
jgi:phosphocarrier protein HPr